MSDIKPVQITETILRDAHQSQAATRMTLEDMLPACEVLDSIGMYHLRNETVDNLAYGRQKVCELGRALMTTPQLILLDEPAAGLNPSERREFVDILRKVYDSGIDLFLIEHNMDIIKCADWIVDLGPEAGTAGGRVVFEGTPRELEKCTESHTGKFLRMRAKIMKNEK